MTGKNTTTKNLSMCGVTAALCIVILMFSAAIGIGTYAGPLLASLALIPVLDSCGKKYALMTFAVSSVLALIFIPDRELAFFYLLFAWYPIGLRDINKIKSKALRLVIKVSCYSLIVFILYGVVVKFLIGFNPEDELASWINVLMFILGLGAFLLLDFIYVNISRIWKKKGSHI